MDHIPNEPAPPVLRFRLHGLRKLNWVQRSGPYLDHLKDTGFDDWIEPGELALVVGPNGGGKSTIIDLFRALADAALWPGLARENYPGEDFSGFDVEGPAFSLRVRFSKYTPRAEDVFDKLTILAVAETRGASAAAQAVAPRFSSDTAWAKPLQDLLDQIVQISVRHDPATGRRPCEDVDDDALIALLNELSEHFPSVLANPRAKPFSKFRGAGDAAGRIGVLFKDDGGQHAFVHRDMLPLGWLQLAAVLKLLRDSRARDLILLDEPDRHLHPSLQRVMIELVSRERARLGAQVVLATHSSALINPELCERVGARTIVAARGRCELLTDARRLLDDLGVTSGDLVQANGVVWVEGPSDRLYVKRWLELFARDRGAEPPIERIHYAFVSYGGALLKHIGLSDASAHRLDLRSINRNFAVLIDSDRADDAPAAMAAEKERLLGEAAALAEDEAIWVSEAYTIEAYLPAAWPPAARHVAREPDGRVRVRGLSKVDLATRFSDAPLAWPESFAPGCDVPTRIAALFKRIKAWQSPQETIEPSYLPPFLLDPQA